MKTRIKIILFASLLVFASVITGYIFLYNQNPLHMDGFTEYNDERKKIDVSLANDGFASIRLLSVQINNRQTPTEVKLVASYDFQLVAGGIDDNKEAKFLGLHEMPILPQLSNEKIKEAMETKDRPINYGIRITSEHDIESIEIKYQYLGMNKTKKINLDLWNQSNK